MPFWRQILARNDQMTWLGGSVVWLRCSTLGGRRAPGGALGGVPPVKGVWGCAPGCPPQAPILGAFLADFHEVLLLFWDQLKPKNGYKYSHSSC